MMRDKPRQVEGNPKLRQRKGFFTAAALEKFSRPRGPAGMSSSRVERMAHSRARRVFIHETSPRGRGRADETPLFEVIFPQIEFRAARGYSARSFIDSWGFTDKFNVFQR